MVCGELLDLVCEAFDVEESALLVLNFGEAVGVDHERLVGLEAGVL